MSYSEQYPTLPLDQWIKTVNALEGVTQIRTVDDIPVLLEALKRHKGNDPAPVSILWLWVTARVTKHAGNENGLWVWQRQNQASGKPEYLVCATSPDLLEKIMIFPSHTTTSMVIDFIHKLPFPNGGYDIVRVPLTDINDLAIRFHHYRWGLRLREDQLVDRLPVYAQDFLRKHQYDYAYYPLIYPTVGLAGKIVNNAKGTKIFIERNVVDRTPDDFLIEPSDRKERLKDGLKLYQRDARTAETLVDAEPFDTRGQDIKSEYKDFIDCYIESLDKKITPQFNLAADGGMRAQTYREFYGAVFECFYQLQGQFPHPRFGERFRGYLFRRKQDRLLVGFELFEVPFADNPIRPVAQSTAGLAIVDPVGGVKGLPAYILRYVARQLNAMGVEGYCQGGVERQNTSLASYRAKIEGLPGTEHVEIGTYSILPTPQKYIRLEI